MSNLTILVSETQLKAIKAFFNEDIDDILYGGAARGGKSEVIGILLAICIIAFPGSSWLLSRTVLADLKATTLASFLKVIKRIGYTEKSYKDKIRDEKHIEFENGSKLFVVQTNYEPSDPEFDRIGSYEFTGGFLDEGQSMSNQVREVLFARLSNTSGIKRDEIPAKLSNMPIEQFGEVNFTVDFKVVKWTLKPTADIKDSDIDMSKVIEETTDGLNRCFITENYTLKIPYKPIKVTHAKNKAYLHSAWNYNGIVFTGCNPGTNFTRTEFWVPYKDNNMPKNRAFIPSKVGDNPWVDKAYIERLHRLPETSVRKQRLLYGNFDYSDDNTALFTKQDLDNVFVDEISTTGTKYLTIDAARQGKDSTEIGIWYDLNCSKIIKIKDTDFIDNGYKIGDLVYQKSFIEDIINKEDIDLDNVIVDEVGVGGGLVDMLGCRGFIGNSSALNPYASKLLEYKKRNYINLRTQAYFYLQSYIDKVKIKCSIEDKQEITDELLATKQKDVDNDVKISLIGKTAIKEQIGRSPDKADMISMRMWWIIKQHHTTGEAVEDVKYDERKVVLSEAHKRIEDFLRFEEKNDEVKEIEFGAF